MRIIKFFLIQSLIMVFIFISCEFSLKYYFQETSKLNCLVAVNSKLLFANKKNCKFEERYFEKKSPTIYITNNEGNRVGTDKEKNIGFPKLYFFGDSFTFGYLSNFEKTYPYVVSKNLNNKVTLKNLGVNGYQFEQILYQISKITFEADSKIIYGLTPNDLYDIEIYKKKIVNDDIKIVDKIKKQINKFNIISLKFITSKILKNDEIYLLLNQTRGDKAGYLTGEKSSFWEKRFDFFENKIKKLDNSLKKRIIISIIPQQAQIKLYKRNKKEIYFDKKILEICKRNSITCFSFTEQLALKTNYQAHYPLDGHLLPESNIIYGNMLAKKINELK